jgi:hypothetical protein
MKIVLDPDGHFQTSVRLMLNLSAVFRAGGVVSFSPVKALIRPGKLLLRVGKLKIGLLQPQTALAALFVVRLLRQRGAANSLSSKELCSRHSRTRPLMAHCSIYFPAMQQKTVWSLV